MEVEGSSESKYADMISQECEYFTQVMLRKSGPEKVFYETNSKNQSAKLNVQGACQLIVQASYLCFYSFRHRIPLEIDVKQDVVLDARQLVAPQSTGVVPLLTYSISGQPIQVLKPYLTEILTAILAFCGRLSPLASAPSLSNFSRELEMMKTVNFPEEKDFVFALEETPLFRSNGLMLRLMNCLFMHLLKKDNESLERFFKCRKQQAEYVAQYIDAKKSKNEQKVAEVGSSITRLIREFFIQLGNVGGCKCTKTESEGSNEIKLSLRLKEKQLGLVVYMRKFTQNQINTEPIDFKPSELQYQIDYNGQRNTLTVRLLTDLRLSIEQGDFLLFQMNRLTYDSAEIGIEVAEVGEKQQSYSRNKQFILKTTQQSSAKQCILQSIMELLDTVTVVFKIIEPQLTRIITREIDISEETHRRINHYMRIFKNSYRCVYRLDER